MVLTYITAVGGCLCVCVEGGGMSVCVCTECVCVSCFSFLPSKWKRLPRSVRRTQMLKKLKSRRFVYAETLPCVSSSCVVLVAIVCV